jgi:hypothetical protein
MSIGIAIGNFTFLIDISFFDNKFGLASLSRGNANSGAGKTAGGALPGA